MDDEILFKIVNLSHTELQNILDHNILTGPFNADKAIWIILQTAKGKSRQSRNLSMKHLSETKKEVLLRLPDQAITRYQLWIWSIQHFCGW